jgi:hypothetical protein
MIKDKLIEKNNLIKLEKIMHKVEKKLFKISLVEHFPGTAPKKITIP